nr:integrase, catalytic region, zinc finger, CCHC-type, peptidase aspartic, catalytic [Tanacetum cinerariifolium]
MRVSSNTFKRSTMMETSATREYSSLIYTFFMTHTVGGVFLNLEDKAIYDEMLRLQGLGSNTPTGQHTVILPPSQGTHLANIDRLKKREKQLTKQVNMFKRLFRSHDKFSQMLTQLESQPKYVGGSGSGGCGDDEPGDDEDGGEDEEEEEEDDNLDTFSSVRRPKQSNVIWKKKGSSNISNVDLSSISHSKLRKDVKQYSRKDLLSCNNSHLGETSSAYVCNDAMNVSCNSRLCDSFNENNLFIFDDESVRISPVSKMPFRKKPHDSMNVHSKSNLNKSLPRTVHRWLPKMQPLAEPVAKWVPRIFHICLWIIDSGCSKHMMGNRALLTNFVEKFLGTVRFGNNDFAVIAGYGDVVIGSMTIKKAYYVEVLGHKLFSVGEFCDKGLEVAFRKSTCFVRNEDGNIGPCNDLSAPYGCLPTFQPFSCHYTFITSSSIFDFALRRKKDSPPVHDAHASMTSGHSICHDLQPSVYLSLPHFTSVLCHSPPFALSRHHYDRITELWMSEIYDTLFKCLTLEDTLKDPLSLYTVMNYTSASETILQDSSEPSNDNTNVVNDLQDPFVVKQDPGENSSQSPPQINHHCCYGCGDSLEDIFCHQCTCELCGKGAHYGYNCPPKVLIMPNPEPFNNQTIDELPQNVPIFDPTCYFKDGNSFTYDSTSNLIHDSPNVFDPPSQPPLYSCEFCENDARYGHYCTPQVSFIYLEPGCLDQKCPVLSGTVGSLRNHRKFNRISFFETPKVLLLAWDRVFKIKDAHGNKQYKPEDIQELLRELFNDVQNIHEELDEYINTPGWNRPAFCNNGDDDDEDCTIAVTPDFSITDSLIMENEHLDTIPETESDEFIKSCVENLVPIPSKFGDFSDIASECDVPDCDDSQTTNFSTFSNPLFDDSTSSDDESSHEEVIRKMSFKTYSNPLFDLDEEIISSEFNLIHNEDLNSTTKNDRFDTKSYLLESLLNRDESIPPGIDNDDLDFEGDNIFLERLLHDDPIPLPNTLNFSYDV